MNISEKEEKEEEEKEEEEEMALNFDVNAEIQKELESISDEETDVNMLATVTHRALLMLSVKDTVIQMRQEEQQRKKENEEEKNDENEIEIFHEKIRTSYLEKIDFF